VELWDGDSWIAAGSCFRVVKIYWGLVEMDNEPYPWYLSTWLYFYYFSLIVNRLELVRLG
jgi:hypothetical protein